MRRVKNIVLIFVLLAAWIHPALSQGEEYVSVVCAGDTGVSYYVSGWENSTFHWAIEGGEIVRNYGDSIIVDWGMEPGEYVLEVQEISEHGCAGPPQKGIVLLSGPEITIGTDQYICEGETVTLEVEGDFSSILWMDGSALTSFTTDVEGYISCIATDENGCKAEDSIYLEVKPLPYVDLGPDTTLCGDMMLVLDGGMDAISYNWSTGDISREIDVYQGYQEIVIDIEDDYGCENSDSITIDACDPAVYFSDIPNALTPANKDGRNDYWVIDKLASYPDAEVDIYDRWGRLLWRSEPGYPSPWDGTNMNGAELPMDSYHYVIILNFGNDDRVSGIVTVIR